MAAPPLPKPEITDAIRVALAQTREPWLPLVLGGLAFTIAPVWSGHRLPVVIRLARLGREVEHALFRSCLDPIPAERRLEGFRLLMETAETWLHRDYLPWDALLDEGLDAVDVLLLCAAVAAAIEGGRDLTVRDAVELVPEGVELPEETMRRFDPDAPLLEGAWVRLATDGGEELVDRMTWLDMVTRLRALVAPTPEAGGMLGPLRDYPLSWG